MKTKISDIIFVSATVALFILVFCVHVNVTQQKCLPRIFGERDNAVLDMWSVQHLISGIFLGSILARISLFQRISTIKFFATIFFVALTWEVAELSMEYGWFGQTVSIWKKGYEHWGNRFFGDISLVVMGSIIARKFRSAWKIVLIPSALWLVVNVASPNSMSVQESLLRMLYGFLPILRG